MPGFDPFKGHASQIAVGVETEQGTAVAPTRHLGKLDEETEHTDPEINWYDERLIGGNREVSGRSPGQRSYDGGSYPVILTDALPLAMLFGREDFDSMTNTHTIYPRMDGMPPSMTVEATFYGRGGGADFVRTFDGVTVDSGELGTDNDDRLTCSLETIALGVSTGITPTDVGTVTDADPWIFSDVSSDLSFAGTTFARLQDFSLSVNNNVGARYYITSNVSNRGDPYEILYGNVDYEFTATITIDDSTLYDELVGPTLGGVAANIAFTRSNGDTLTIDLSGLNIQEAPHSTPRGESADDETVDVEATMLPQNATITVEDSVSASAVL